MFSGLDCLAIATVFAATAIGFPQRWAGVLADAVVTRAKFRAADLGMVSDFEILAWPIPGSDDWAKVETWRGAPAQDLPEAYHRLRVDALIDRVTAQLESIIDERPFPETETPRSAADLPQMVPGMWTRDAQGRQTLVGLSHGESKELAKLLGKKDAESVARFWALDEKHRAALDGGEE